MAMAHFGTSQVVPVYYVLFTLASVMGGIIMYREFTSMKAAQILAFFCSVAITFIGVYLVTSDRPTSPEDEERMRQELENEDKDAEEDMARIEGVMMGGGLGSASASSSPPSVSHCSCVARFFLAWASVALLRGFRAGARRLAAGATLGATMASHHDLVAQACVK